MKSPFPGMDPYIEACGLWEGFHGHLIEDIYRSLARQLPRGYTIDTAERTYIVMLETEGKEESLRKPDVAITEASRKKPRRQKGGAGVVEAPAEAGSVSMRAFVAEEVKERFIEIHAQGEERILVTCIEILSPTNKRPRSQGRKKYLRKREAMLLGQANFIEIDLLRGGSKPPMLDPWPECPYTLLVCREVDAPRCRVWKAHFQERLPIIPVPLSYQDSDLPLDLQPLIDGIYELGRYDERINYRRPLRPR